MDIDDWSNLFWIIFIIIMISALFLVVIGALITVFTAEWGDNEYKNQLTKEYIIEFYPEFKDCDVYYFYGGWFVDMEKAKIYCDIVKNKDGLKVMRDIHNQEPTITLKFSNITFKNIEKLKLIEGWGR